MKDLFARIYWIGIYSRVKRGDNGPDVLPYGPWSPSLGFVVLLPLCVLLFAAVYGAADRKGEPRVLSLEEHQQLQLDAVTRELESRLNDETERRRKADAPPSRFEAGR